MPRGGLQQQQVRHVGNRDQDEQRCGADGEAPFVAFYGRGFDQYRARLSKNNLESFYAGICESWRDALEQSRRSAAEAETQRQQIIAANAERRLEAQMRNASSRTLRNAALGFAFSAIVAFMMIALFLAFLAIEGHSAAVRAAIELLANREAANEQSNAG